MKPYLICCDIDGTLMSSQQTISQATINMIKYLQSQGHLFFLATGRMFLSAQNIAKNISPQTGIIASNGGILFLNNHTIKHTFDYESILSIYKIAMHYQIPLFFFSDTTVYYSLILPEYFTNKTDQGRIDTGMQESYCFIKNSQHLIEQSSAFINAIMISEDKLTELEQAKQQLKEIQTLNITSSFWNNIEIIPNHVSKALAIKEIQKYYSIPPERTISFGDGGNDIEMFKASGISVAMENACDSVKKQATHITLSNNEEGVYYFLNQFFMEENQNG